MTWVALPKRRRSLSLITALRSTWSISLVSTCRSTMTCSRPRNPLSSANSSASGRNSSRASASMKSTRPLTQRSELTQQRSQQQRNRNLCALKFKLRLRSSNRTPRRESGSDNSRLAELHRSSAFRQRLPRSLPISSELPSLFSECLATTFIGQLYDQTLAVGAGLQVEV